MTTQVLRGFWDVNWFVARVLRKRSILSLVVSIIIFIIGAISWCIEFYSTADYIGAILMAVGGIGVLKDIISLTKDWLLTQKYFIKPSKKIKHKLINLRIDDDYNRSGYKIEKISEIEYVVRSPQVDKIIRQGTLEVKQDNCLISAVNEALRTRPEIFEAALRSHFKQSRRAHPPKKFINEEKTCLWSDILLDAKALYVYKGTYYHSFLTNELVTKVVESDTRRPECVYDGYDNFPAVGYRDTFVIQSLGHSRMANHIGISTILFTKDKKLVFWRQSTRAQQSCDLLAPTVSGSCDWSDWRNFPPPQRINNLLQRAMEREFREESFPLKMALQNVEMTTCVLGFFRWMRRGGKPEFVGVTKSEATFSHLEANLEEVDHPANLNIFSCQSIDQMLEVISYFVSSPKVAGEEANHFDLSVPLWVNLMCLGEALREDPQY